MTIVFKILEFVAGAAGLIGWVTVLGILFSKVAPQKLIKKTVTLEDCIAMAGIGLFCTFITLFFLFIVPNLGLARLQLGNIFGSLISGGHDGQLHRWAGRVLVISCGVMGSFIYGSLFFRKLQLSTFLRGLSFGVTGFAVAAFLIFPLISYIPGVQMGNLSLPAISGPLKGSGEEIMTLLAATLVFGALLSNIYHQWEEA